MEEKVRVYKVVQFDDTQIPYSPYFTEEYLWSAVISTLDGGVRYVVRHETFPTNGCGPLMAWRSLKSANAFASRASNKTVYIAEATVNKGRDVWCIVSERRSLEYICEFSDFSPDDIVLCDSLTLIERAA